MQHGCAVRESPVHGARPAPVPRRKAEPRPDASGEARVPERAVEATARSAPAGLKYRVESAEYRESETGRAAFRGAERRGCVRVRN